MSGRCPGRAHPGVDHADRLPREEVLTPETAATPGVRSTTCQMTPVRDAPDVLIVDDNADLRMVLRAVLSRQGYRVVEASDEAEATEALGLHRPALVLSDLRLPVGDGLGVLRAAKEFDPALPVILMTGYGAIEDAVHAMREGALDYLPKPVDQDHLLLIVSRAIAQRRLATENVLLREALGARHGIPVIVGEHPVLLDALRQLRRVALTDSTVLLGGESGTGKELFARSVHAFSERADGPFVAINCAAIPETLLESELFGHEKGAFTGAQARKPGRFELAHRGTLFLDEIGEMPMSLQAKVLRVLQERSFERVGGNATLHVDVRVVAASNRDLRQAVRERRFREDLFFRLAVFPLTIPPLRDRPTDIPLLARHFIEIFARDMNKRPQHLTSAAEAALCAHPWPGNIRELQNCMERAVILAHGDAIHPHYLHLGAERPGADRAQAPDADPWGVIDLSGTLAAASRRVLAEVERRKIQDALDTTGWNRDRAAALLEVPPRLLLAKIREYQLRQKHGPLHA
jgi:DNA-binding NtrC family response regulator